MATTASSAVVSTESSVGNGTSLTSTVDASAAPSNSVATSSAVTSRDSAAASTTSVSSANVADSTSGIADTNNVSSSEVSSATSASSSSEVDVASSASKVDGSANAESANANRMVAATTSSENGLVTQNGDTYYYLNGVKQTNYFLGQNGKMYYFGLDGKEYKNRFYYNWGNMYYFGSDGARYTNQFYYNWGNMYYFGDNGVRYTNQFYYNWGNMYYFGGEGVRYTNQFYYNWGKMYYFGDGGVRYTNKFYTNWGNVYYFGSDGARMTNQTFAAYGATFTANSGGVLQMGRVNNYIFNNGIRHAALTYYYVIPSVTDSYSGTDDGLPNMVVIHETANPYDSIWGEINYERANYEDAFVHAFVDGSNIIIISPTNKEAWGAAYPANGRAVQVEQVEVYGARNFASELANAAYFAAYEMKLYGMTPSMGQSNGTGTLWSHHMVSNYLGGTDHTDPDGYWANRASSYFGTTYTMTNFIQLVAYYYATM